MQCQWQLCLAWSLAIVASYCAQIWHVYCHVQLRCPAFASLLQAPHPVARNHCWYWVFASCRDEGKNISLKYKIVFSDLLSPVYAVGQLVQTHQYVQRGYLTCDYDLLQPLHLWLPMLLDAVSKLRVKVELLWYACQISPGISHACDLIEWIATLEYLRTGYGLDNTTTRSAPDQTAIFAFVQRCLCVCNHIAQLGAAFNLWE